LGPHLYPPVRVFVRSIVDDDYLEARWIQILRYERSETAIEKVWASVRRDND
jgi:hypothetical protein